MSPPAAEPFYFGPPERPLAGWLHRPEGPAKAAVLLCNPFGYEEICAHWALRRFAQALAGAGIAAMRFDYDGCGDSAGDDRDPDRLDAWVESTRVAARTLRELAGTETLFVLGMRLGTLIGALAAKDLGAAGFVAIAPVVTGKGYLREQKMLQASIAHFVRPDGVTTDTGVDEGGQEANGFGLYAATCKAIGAVDLAKIAPAPAPKVLVVDRDDLPSAGKWIEHLRGQGAEVTAHELPGYVGMKDKVPEAMIRATVEWLAARADGPSREREAKRSGVFTEAELGDVVERPIFADADRRIFGVLTAPKAAARSGRAVLLLNAGAIHRIGPNRTYVTLARKWAADGDVVLRLDITGIGDSPARPGEIENTIYSNRAVEDVGEAVAWLNRQPGVRDVWAMGLCSGAYHALKAAVAGHPMKGYVAINPLTFFWTPDLPLEFPQYQVTQVADSYKRAMLSPEKWKKVLRGEVDVKRAVEAVGRRQLRRLVDHARDVSRTLRFPWKDDVGVELLAVAERGVAQRFVFASPDPGRALLADQAGSALVKLRKQGKVAIDVIDGPDHTFTPMWSHAPLVRVLTSALGPR